MLILLDTQQVQDHVCRHCFAIQPRRVVKQEPEIDQGWGFRQNATENAQRAERTDVKLANVEVSELRCPRGGCHHAGESVET